MHIANSAHTSALDWGDEGWFADWPGHFAWCAGDLQRRYLLCLWGMYVSISYRIVRFFLIKCDEQFAGQFKRGAIGILARLGHTITHRRSQVWRWPICRTAFMDILFALYWNLQWIETAFLVVDFKPSSLGTATWFIYFRYWYCVWAWHIIFNSFIVCLCYFDLLMW